MATIDARTFSLRDARNATIRTAEPSDAAEVLAFRKTVSDETECLMGAADEIRRGVAQQAEHLQATLLSPVDLSVLAEVEGRVAGLARLEGSTLRRFAHGVTLGIAVARELWRLGLGRALLESVLRAGTSAGRPQDGAAARASSGPTALHHAETGDNPRAPASHRTRSEPHTGLARAVL